MTVRFPLVLVSTMILVGCASGGIQFNSQTFDSGAAPAKNMVIYFNAKSPHFTGTLYATFVAATQRRIESCSVKVSAIEFDPLDLDMQGKLNKLVEQSNADVMLSFLRDGGNLLLGPDGVSGSHYFNVDTKGKNQVNTIWKARIDFKTLTGSLFANDKLSGERFAKQFVSKLASDRVIGGCPPEVVAGT